MAEERRVEVAAGVRLAVRIHRDDGPAHPFLLVHGLASNARLWDGVAEVLANLGHAVAAVDLRGHGRSAVSANTDSGYDFATIAADVAAVVADLGWDRPVLAGQSWGANAVVEVAARHRGVAAAIACVDGGTNDLSESFPSWDECRDALTPPKLIGTPLADIERQTRAVHPDWPESGIQGALGCFAVRENGTVEPHLTLDRHLAIVRAMWEQRPIEALRRIDVPVLLLPVDTGGPWTEKKRIGVARAEQVLADVRTHWFTADHDVHAQHPDEVACLLHDFAGSA